MPPLSSEDREWVKAIAAQIAVESVERALIAFVQRCPHGKTLLRTRWMMIGIGVGVSLISGGAGVAVARLLSQM